MADNAETYATPKPHAKDIQDPAQLARIIEQAKTGVTRVSAETPMPANPPIPPVEQTPPAEYKRPEKFKTEADLGKAYLELEKKLSQIGQQKTQQEAPAKGTEDLKIPERTEAEIKADAELAKAGIKLEEFSAEYAKNGALAPESYAKLDKAGIPKAMVDSYIAGQEAIAINLRNDLHSVAGGPEKFAEMHKWASTGLDAASQAGWNKAIESNDHQQIKLAAAALHAKWLAAVGSDPVNEIHGMRASAHAGDVYTHSDELKADLRNPEYKKNQAFRDRVAAKVKRSPGI